MRKNIIIILLIITNILTMVYFIKYKSQETKLINYGQISVINSQNDESIVILDGDFYDYIKKNPIDLSIPIDEYDLIQKNISNTLLYADLWEKEIIFATEKLEEYLSEEDYNILYNANQKYIDYINDSFELEISLYYIGMKYQIGDSMTYANTSRVKALRTKKRAIEVLSYLYSFTGTVEFNYSLTILD